MISILNKNLSSLPKSKRYLIANLACFLADVIVIYYVSLKIGDFFTEKHLIFMLKNAGADSSKLAHFDLVQFRAMALSNIKLMLFIVLIFNCINYLFSQFQKAWAMKYVKRYAFFGFLFSILEFVGYLVTGNGINFYTLAGLLLYFLCWHIFKFNQQNQEQ